MTEQQKGKDWSAVGANFKNTVKEEKEEAPQPAAEAAEEPSEEAVAEEQVSSREQALEQQLQQAQEQMLRIQAESQNMRRRADQDVVKARKFALEKFIGDLLPVIDSLDQALQAGQDEQGKLHEGVEMTVKMFADALAKHGVETVDPMGKAFDPNFHEAMANDEHSSAEPGTVVFVMQKGYVLNQRLIRPARVVVAKGNGEGKPATPKIDEQA